MARAVAWIRTPGSRRSASRSTSQLVRRIGWQSGINSAVRRAAMIPARRATASTSPLPRAPLAWSTSRSVSRRIFTAADAVAVRAVSGLSATSTIRAAPRASTCDSRFPVFTTVTLLYGDALGEVARLVDVVPLGDGDRVAHELQRQHGQ